MEAGLRHSRSSRARRVGIERAMSEIAAFAAAGLNILGTTFLLAPTVSLRTLKM
jgi:hypothetical protein